MVTININEKSIAFFLEYDPITWTKTKDGKELDNFVQNIEFCKMNESLLSGKKLMIISGFSDNSRIGAADLNDLLTGDKLPRLSETVFRYRGCTTDLDSTEELIRFAKTLCADRAIVISTKPLGPPAACSWEDANNCLNECLKYNRFDDDNQSIHWAALANPEEVLNKIHKRDKNQSPADFAKSIEIETFIFNEQLNI